jgi:chromosome segregation ATPase
MMEDEKLIEWVKKKLPELLRTDEEFRALLLGTLVHYLPTREEFTAILERLERIERELEEIRKEQAALRQDFQAMQRTLIEQGQAILAMQQAITEQGQAIRELQQTVVEQGRAIQGLQQTVAEQGRAIQGLQQAVMELQQAVAEQGRAIQELQQTVAEQGRAIQGLQQAVIELGQAVRVLFERVERLEVAHAELAGEVHGLRQEMQGLREDFTRLERRVDVGFARFGILSEEVLRRSLQVAIEAWLKAGRVQTMELAGRQVDVVIRDAEHVILEVTARAHLQDIDKLKMAARDYEHRFGVRPRLAIACAYITPVVVARLIEEGIELISAEVPE